VLSLVTKALGNLFDAHPCLEQQVSRLLHAQTNQQLRWGGAENIFEPVPNRVVIPEPTDLPSKLGRATDALINQMPELQNI
jgi:hypothetical protein